MFKNVLQRGKMLVANPTDRTHFNWRDGRNGIIAPILKIGGGDEPSVGSYPAPSANLDVERGRIVMRQIVALVQAGASPVVQPNLQTKTVLK